MLEILKVAFWSETTVNYGSYHCEGGRAAVKLPVERQSSQLTLQFYSEVTIIPPYQGNLGAAIRSTVTS